MFDFENAAEQIVSVTAEKCEGNCTITHQTRTKAIQFLELLRAAIYPKVFDEESLRYNGICCVTVRNLRRTSELLEDVCEDIFSDKVKAAHVTEKFMESVPKLASLLNSDIQAAYDGDPAAKSRTEVMLAYPAFEAISTFRVAHELLVIGVPLLPRILTENAHRVTGIDIHPGATIGKYFFIDHGTGIVIGETTIIGEHVKIYQGVTLGGLSTQGGQKLKGAKRHPTIGDNVTIYSGASILGGETIIEDNVVVGGNTFITNSVEKDTRVTAKKQELQYKNN